MQSPAGPQGEERKSVTRYYIEDCQKMPYFPMNDLSCHENIAICNGEQNNALINFNDRYFNNIMYVVFNLLHKIYTKPILIKSQ